MSTKMLKYVIFLVAIIVSSIEGKHCSKLKKRHKHKTCAGGGCRSAIDTILKYMDPKVNPCDDFYQFACGRFLKHAHIPEDRGIVGPMYNLINDVVEKLGDTIGKLRRRGTIKPFRLIKKLYKSCMNKKQIEKHGTQALNTFLTDLGGWPVLKGNKFDETRFDWTLIMYNLRKFGYPTDSLITVDVREDPKNSTKSIIMLSQASLGLEKEFLDLGTNEKVVKTYKKSMVKIAKNLGACEAFAAKELKNSFEFERALANISLPLEKLANWTAIYNPTTLAKLQKNHPSVQWLKYITNILKIRGIKVAHHEVIIVETPQYIKDLENLLKRTTKRILANYIMWRVVQFSMDYLPERFSNVMLRLRMVQEGTLEKQQRSTECAKNLLNNMPLAMGSLYVRKFFSKSLIKPVKKMVSQLVSAFGRILNKASWMDKTTKANALKKLAAMAIHVGHAKEIVDDRKLIKYYSDLNSDNYLLQMLSVSKFNEDKKFGLLRQSRNKAKWSTRESAAIANAYYLINGNEMHILAAVMQAPYFSNDRPQYMNYGAMGFVIGHEITHGFDQNGGLFNKYGNLFNWWSKSTKKAFQEKVQCMVEQYGNFTVPELGNMHLKGRLTANENIADHGGLLAAYEAYNLWSKNKDTRPSLNYTRNQMFWISHANSFCAKFRDLALKQQVLVNLHSPVKFRILGPLRNLKNFSKDFKCPLGSNMNPTQKCLLWEN